MNEVNCIVDPVQTGDEMPNTLIELVSTSDEVVKPLMQMLEEAGYPKEDMFNHESDLYIYATPLTKRVLEEWCEAHGWDKRLIGDGMMCSGFRDNITGKPMYDVTLQYLPWLEERWNRNAKSAHELL